MKQSKSRKHNGIDSKLDNTTGKPILAPLKDGRRLIFIESYFTILKGIQEKTGHGGRDEV